MDKAFYFTDSHIQLIDLIKLRHGEQYLLDTVNMENVEAVEEMLLTFNATKGFQKQTFVIIIDLIDEIVDFNWSYKLMPWERAPYEKQIKDKFYNEGGEFIKIIWQNQFQKNTNNVAEQMIMTVSINKNKQLKHFLLMLEDAQMSVVAIYSYQLLLQKYFLQKIVPKVNVSKNKIKNPFLLVFQEDKYSFKQFFFHNGSLRLVRNIKVAEEIILKEDIIDSLISESLSMVKYMYNQKTLPFNSEVGLVYIGLDTFKDINVINKFQKQMPYESNEEKSIYKHLNLSSIVNNNQKNTSLKQLDLLANYLAKTTITTFYTNKFTNKVNLFINIGKGLIFLIFLILFIGTTYLIHLGVSNYLLKENTAYLEQQLSVLQVEKNNLQQAIQLESDAEDIKASVDFSEAILKFKDEKQLEIFLKHFSIVLAEHENIIISQLSWNKKQYWDDRVMIFLFEGWVFPFNKSYQQPVEWVDKLIAELHGLPGFIEIALLKEPLNRDLQQTISISAEDLQQVVALPFSLSVTVGKIDANAK